MSKNEKKVDSIDIIDLDSLENKSELTNTEYILTIMEICLNSAKYNLTHPNNTRAFWDDVMNNEKISSILKMFKAETLRKYWRIIRDLNQHDQMMTIINNNTDLINNPCYKYILFIFIIRLLPMINAMTEFIKSKETDFDKYLLTANKAKVDNKKKEEEGHTGTLLNHKRKANDIEKPIITKTEISKPIIKANTICSVEPNKIIEKSNDDVNKVEDDDITLEEIIDTLNEQFPNKKKDDIYQALFKMSGKIKDTYLFLSDPDKYEKLTFIGTDDYILQHLRGKDYYNELVEHKGEEQVKERERFLNIKLETDK